MQLGGKQIKNALLWLIRSYLSTQLLSWRSYLCISLEFRGPPKTPRRAGFGPRAFSLTQLDESTGCCCLKMETLWLTCGISCCWRHRVPLRSRRPGWWSCAPAGSHSPAALWTGPDPRRWSGPEPQLQTGRNRSPRGHCEPGSHRFHLGWEY